MNLRLKGKVALITGAAKGIGQAIAEVFANEGATVILSDIDDQGCQQTAKQIGAAAHFIHLDVQEESDWQKATDSIISQFAKLDILVNNAGITGFSEEHRPHDPENASLEDWRFVHAVNLDGVFLGCKYGIKSMKSNPGSSIINISSRSGLVGIPGAAAYASSKAAVRNHTKTVALYCCEKGYPIRCNAILPAAILTPMWDAMLGKGEAKKQAINIVSQDIPMKNMGEPEDVAYAALYLASNESKYITGTDLNIDGGILAGTTASPKQKE